MTGAAMIFIVTIVFGTRSRAVKDQTRPTPVSEAQHDEMALQSETRSTVDHEVSIQI